MKTKLKKFLKNILKSKITMKIIGYLVYLYGKLVFKTCKWEFRGLEKFLSDWDKEKSIVTLGWHGRLLMPIYIRDFRKQYKGSALVSLHQDGQIIANFLKHHDFSVIGGSTSRNAKSATINVLNTLKKDELVIIIPDGPNGPNMKLTDSPIYFAQKTQKPIYAIIYSIENSIIVRKSWDQAMIPKPFNKGIMSFIGPLYIPEKLSEEEFEKYKINLENKMNDTLLAMDKEMGIEKIEIGKVNSRRRDKKAIT